MKYNENNKKYNINQNYFSEWSNNMAYILGFVYADGNLDKNKYRLRISSVDKNILEEINKEFESDRDIRLESNSIGEWYTLVVDNRQIYNDLIKLGVTPNKSKTCNIPNIPKNLIYDFLRGVFDGDGCVYSKHHKDSSIPTLSIDIATASNKFKDSFLKLTNDIVDDKHNFTIQTRKNGLNIIRANTTVSERFYNKIYYEGCMHLKRKKNKFDEILNQRKNRKKKLPKSHKV